MGGLVSGVHSPRAAAGTNCGLRCFSPESRGRRPPPPVPVSGLRRKQPREGPSTLPARHSESAARVPFPPTPSRHTTTRQPRPPPCPRAPATTANGHQTHGIRPSPSPGPATGNPPPPGHQPNPPTASAPLTRRARTPSRRALARPPTWQAAKSHASPCRLAARALYKPPRHGTAGKVGQSSNTQGQGVADAPASAQCRTQISGRDLFSYCSTARNGHHGDRGGQGRAGGAGQRQRQRRAEDAPLRGRTQEPAQERRPLPVHPGHERVPAGAGEHEGAPRDHRQAPMEPDDDLRRRGAVPQHAHQAHRRQEDHGDRRLHRLLPPRHRARSPGGRHDLGHGHQPRELRAGPALHREGRRRPQDRLPRGPRAPRPRRPHRRREEPRVVRLRLRGRRQGQLPQLPRPAAQAGEAGGPHRLRQHAVERLCRAPRRRPHAQVHPLLPRLRARPQQGARRRRARRDLPAPRRRRRHPLPPRQVKKNMPGHRRRRRRRIPHPNHIVDDAQH